MDSIDTASVTLVVRKTIRATREALFAAWTEPEQLKKWWGPPSVDCTVAEIDLRVGGSYRLANRFPNGNVIWITGLFEAIDPPRRLVYTWTLGEAEGPAERVTVTFRSRGKATEVTIRHQRIPPAEAPGHEQGWIGCLDGLIEYLAKEA